MSHKYEIRHNPNGNYGLYVEVEGDRVGKYFTFVTEAPGLESAEAAMRRHRKGLVFKYDAEGNDIE